MAEIIQEEIENKIIDIINVGAAGRLIVFKPEKSDKNLVVEKRGDYKKKLIYLDVYSKEFSAGQDVGINVRKVIEEKNPKLEKNLYLVFVFFDIIKQEINDNIWVIPSWQVDKLSKVQDFSRFLLHKKDFSNFLFTEFEKK